MDGKVNSASDFNENLVENPKGNSIYCGEPEQRSDGYWQVNTSYMKSLWIDFDIPNKSGLWIKYIISGLLDK